MRRSNLARIVPRLEFGPLPKAFNRKGRQERPLSSHRMKSCGFLLWASLTASLLFLRTELDNSVAPVASEAPATI